MWLVLAVLVLCGCGGAKPVAVENRGGTASTSCDLPERVDFEARRYANLDADQPDGYERVWRPALEFPPERHLGYAVQWLALAIVAIVIFIALSLQHAPDPESTRS